MKKLLLALVIVALFAIVFSTTASAYTVGATLVTAQVNDPTQAEATGYVHIENDDDYIYVKYWMKAGYCVYDMAVHVDQDLADFPQNNGGAIPGQFEYKYDNGCVGEYTFKISLADESLEIGDTVIIAAHGVVRFPDGTEETGWGARCGCLTGAQFPGNNWSAYIEYPVHAH